jgi:hypothetical protein
MSLYKENMVKRQTGTTQQDRLLPALLPSYVSVDEKSLAENLEFIWNYSSLIKLYDKHNHVYASWQHMLYQDWSFLLAWVQSWEIDRFPIAYTAAYERFRNSLNYPTREKAVVNLFVYALDQADLLGQLSERITTCDPSLLQQAQTLLSDLLRTNLNSTLNLWPESLTWLQNNLIQDPSVVAGRPLEPEMQVVLENLAKTCTFSPAWQCSFFPITTLDGCAQYLYEFNVQLCRCVAEVKQAVPEQLPETLTNPTHAPHIALLLTFSQLMRVAVNSLNKITERHLDFYYKRVLQLAPNPPEPDSVFVQFALSKGVSTALVPKGTALFAGTGTAGEDLVYLTDLDLNVNLAVVTAEKTVFNSGANSAIVGEGALYAAPIAASADGNGGKFPANVPAEWPPFGNDSCPLAEVGFAIADPVLFLSSGERWITLQIAITDDSLQSLLNVLDKAKSGTETVCGTFERLFANAFQVTYTGAKQWESATVVRGLRLVSSACRTDGPSLVVTNGLTLTVYLPPTAAAIVGYDPTIHGLGYAGTFPIMRLIVDQSQSIDVDGSLRDGIAYDLAHRLVIPYGVEDSASPTTLQPYNLLRLLECTAWEIDVRVEGKTDFALQNDYSSLDPQKPFQVFGPSADEGSALYIGSPEVFQKQLTDLSFTMDWFKLPIDTEGFSAYYEVWNTVDPNHPFNNAVFTVGFDLLIGGKWEPLPFKTDDKFQTLTPQDLFRWDAQDCPLLWLTENESESDSDWQVTLGTCGSNGKLRDKTPWDRFDLSQVSGDLEGLTAAPLTLPYVYNAQSDSGFMRMMLNGPSYGFGSQLFQAVNFAVSKWNIEVVLAASKASSSSSSSSLSSSSLSSGSSSLSSSQNANNSSSSSSSQVYLSALASSSASSSSSADDLDLLAIPNIPYVPTGKLFTLNYKASSKYIVGASTNVGVMYDVLPFGASPKATTETSLGLIPNFQMEGTLYLGLEGVVTPQNVTFLMQLDENSIFDERHTVPNIVWSYLTGGNWVNFKSASIIQDGTDNFTHSGILIIQLGETAPLDNGGIFAEAQDAQLFWIRAELPQFTSATCNIIDIDTQAVEATYQVGPSADSHLAAPLPAKTITKMVNPLPTIASITQPMPSFGGAVSETGAEFYVRVSERLRHKQRALTSWDIERILLQAFPQLGLVNCFRNSSAFSIIHPGFVLIVAFPGGPKLEDKNPFTPTFKPSDLATMNTYLQTYIPSEMTTKVINPIYESLQVEAYVRFDSSLDPGQCLIQLNAALCNFIAPWVLAPNDYNPYATKLSATLIRVFIKGLPYVEAVESSTFKVWHYSRGPENQQKVEIVSNEGYFQPKRPWVILTSERQHALYDWDSLTLDDGAMGFSVGYDYYQEVPKLEAPDLLLNRAYLLIYVN